MQLLVDANRERVPPSVNSVGLIQKLVFTWKLDFLKNSRLAAEHQIIRNTYIVKRTK